MNTREWLYRRRVIDDAFYADLVDTARCGPFDGGCVVVAQALQSVIGGQIVVLTRDTDGSGDHAAVLLDGRLWDYDGPMEAERFIRRFERNELKAAGWGCSGYRPFHDGDLDEAFRDEELRERLAGLLREILPEFVAVYTPGGR
ncbi:hypothetical protein G6L37_06670 [Agrobacterium rubi]|nr:hypothetical protein [Agrobacterium rubi]NTF25047.1 hypothetical protein [Agrobacterium rubi]